MSGIRFRTVLMLLAIGAFSMTLALSGCKQESSSPAPAMQEQAEDAADAVKDTASEVKEEAKEAAEETKEAIQEGAAKVEDAAKDAAEAMPKAE